MLLGARRIVDAFVEERAVLEVSQIVEYYVYMPPSGWHDDRKPPRPGL